MIFGYFIALVLARVRRTSATFYFVLSTFKEGKKWKASYDGTAEEVEEYVEDEKVTLTFPDPGSFDGDIVKLDQVTFGYNSDQILLNKIDLSIGIKSRVALLGRNGQGKSTLVKLGKLSD